MKQLFTHLKDPKIFKPLLVGVVILLSVVLYWFYQIRSERVFIDDSLVDAPLITIVPSTSGMLTELDVHEGEYVKKGDRLAIVGGQTLYANTDGLIVSTDNAIDANVNTQTPIIQMINPQDMRIAGTLDENKGLEDVRAGQVVSFTVDALSNQTFWGYVDEVSPSAKATQAAFSISSERPTQQFVVYAKFNSSAYPAIKNGMSAKMTIYTRTK